MERAAVGMGVLDFMFCFGRSQTDTWSWSSGKSLCWDRASGSFPDSLLLLLPLTDSSVGLLYQDRTGGKQRDSDTEINSSHHMHVYAEPIHNYFFQNIPDQILLFFCQRFVPRSVNCTSQQIQSLSWNTACAVTLSWSSFCGQLV